MEGRERRGRGRLKSRQMERMKGWKGRWRKRGPVKGEEGVVDGGRERKKGGGGGGGEEEGGEREEE